MTEGIYEQLINQLVISEIDRLSVNDYYIDSTPLPKKEAAFVLSQYFSKVLQKALGFVKEQDDTPHHQIELANKLIQLLADELKNQGIEKNLINTEGKILTAIFAKLNSPYPNLQEHIQSIFPTSGLSESELFTGNKSGVSLESEIRKEIQSADEVQWIVSFVKFSGLRIFLKDLQEHTARGKKLKLITTTYMGATDAKAIEELARLPNTEIKISYNTKQERLHAKAYLFLRNTQFHTGYIGSSNISRTALTSGLEWNLKVTTQEIPHIIDKFKKTFDTYWNDSEFEPYEIATQQDKLRRAIQEAKGSQAGVQIATFFEITPFPFQQEILERLLAERANGNYKNLVVAATGTGKTVISAFDFKRFYLNNPGAKLLFVAHREEILKQSLATYRHILRDQNFGELWLGSMEPSNLRHVFASVQTLANRIPQLKLSPDFYDFIVVDEVHHIPAKSYRPILTHFTPTILLGLTATPERMDGEDILLDFSNSISSEIRLPEALNRKLLSPFQYFGLADSVDLTQVSWRKGKYDVGALEKVYTETDRRVLDILNNCEKYLTDINDVCALGFCVSRKHALFMSEKFIEKGLKAAALTSDNAGEREALFTKLQKKEINYLFVVDMFNEGVDIPQIDTVLFLRPTESLTIFLQQLGRGLRLYEGKDCLTVLDFVGNSNPEYDFLHKFKAMIGKTHIAIKDEITRDFPHLPLGCSIVLEKRAKEIIVQNIELASKGGPNKLIRKIREFNTSYTEQLTLSNFLRLEKYSLIEVFSKKYTWHALLQKAGIEKHSVSKFENEITRLTSTTWFSTDSRSYFKVILSLLKDGVSNSQIDPLQLLMFFYDIFQASPKKLQYSSAIDGISDVLKDTYSKNELILFLEERMKTIECIEKEERTGFHFPLSIHGRYTRSQILVALQLSTEKTQSSNREGVAENKLLNTEALFVTLDKSKGNYSSTTMYEDYAVNETIFHWQSQNSTRPDSPKGLSYINHQKLAKTMLLFVRERNEDENGLTMGYVYVGPVRFQSYTGSQPMSITWELLNPMPPGLLNDSRKLAVG
jgi:superfamily II DNA or RNA helicase